MSNPKKKQKRPNKRIAKIQGKIHDTCSALGLSPQKIAFLSLLTIAAAGIVIWAAINNRKPDLPGSQYSAQLSLDQQLNNLWEERGDDIPNIFSMVGKLKSCNKEAMLLLQRDDLSLNQAIRLKKLLLRNLRTSVVQLLEFDVDASQEIAELVRHADEFLDHTDTELRQSAQQALCVASVRSFAQDPTSEALNRLIPTLENYSESFVDDQEQATMFYKVLLRARNRFPENQWVARSLSELGVLLSQSSISTIRDLGALSGDSSVYAKFKLQFLEEKIRFNERGADAVLNRAIETLGQHPDSSFETWRMLIQISEAHIASQGIENITRARSRFQKILGVLPDNDVKKTQIHSLLERQRIRLSKLENTLSAMSLLSNERNNSVRKYEYTVLIFGSRNAQTLSALSYLSPSEIPQKRRYQALVVLSDQPDEAETAELKSLIGDDVEITTPEFSKLCAGEFPTDFYPYVLLLDKQNKIVAANISMSQVAPKISLVENSSENNQTTNSIE